MQGEEGVVLIVGQEVVLRYRQLDAEEQRQQPTDKEEQESVEEVHDADFLVVRRGQPRLQVGPEGAHGEGVRAASVEHPHRAEQDEANREEQRRHQDDQRRCTWGQSAGVDAGHNEVHDVPLVAARAVAAGHGVAVDGKLGRGFVVAGSGPFEVPGADGVGFRGVRQASVHDLAC